MPGTEVPAGYGKVQYHQDLYRSFLKRNKNDSVRQTRNWGLFSGVNGKQWDPVAMSVLLSENRAPHSVNFIQKHILSIAGNFYQNDFEFDFEPNVGTSNDDTLTLKSVYTEDRSMGKWQKARRQVILAGLIHRGNIEMYVDYTHDRRGRLAIRIINKNSILYDPDWVSDNVNDNKQIVQWAWMSPSEISRRYKKKTSEISTAIKLWNQTQPARVLDSTEESIKNGNYPIYNDSAEFLDIINNRYLVIQIKRLDRGYKRGLIDMKTGEKMRDMSDLEVDSMMMLRGESLKVYQNEFALEKVTTIVPGLSATLLLEDDALTDLQIGRYTNFTWSALNIDGEVQGPVEVLKDPQEIYNKRESTFTHWQTTAANGAEFVEEDFFTDDTETQRYKDNKNKPGETYIVQPGKISGQKLGIAVRPRGDVPNDLHVSADRAFQMTPEVGYQVPALSGGEGKSGESFKLFEGKRAQALVALEPMTRGLKDFEEELGEAYIYAFKQVYGKAPRVISGGKNNEPILLNIPTAMGTIIGDVSSIRRHKIIVKTSRSGETIRRELLQKYQEILAVTKNPMYASLIERIMIGYLPNIPESEVKMGEDVADLFMKLQNSRVQVEIAQNMAGIEQIKNPPEQQLPPGAGGGGGAPQGPESVSIEGAPVKPGNTPTVDVNNVNQFR